MNKCSIAAFFIAMLRNSLVAAVIGMLLFPVEAVAFDLEARVQKVMLANGLKVLIVERHHSPIVSLYITHRAGAVDEEDGHTGVAHFLEHLMFKGTTSIGTKDYNAERIILEQIHAAGDALDREMLNAAGNADRIEDLKKTLRRLQDEEKKLIIENEIDRIYAEQGAENLNASTGYDLTTYHVNLPSNKIELWARIESDRMANPVFREFYAERDVVMEERRQTVESEPEGQLMERFLATAFAAHPYRRPVIGWPSEMRSFSYDYTDTFFKAYYAPNNTVIAIVGDVAAQETESLIRKYFESIPAHEPPPLGIPAEPVQTVERRVVLEMDANPQLIVGYHKPTLPSFDDYVFDIIDVVLTGGRTSRLYQSLVINKKIAAGISSVNGFPGARYPNLFTIFSTPRAPHTNRELETAIYEELEMLKKVPVGAEELEKAKNQMKADFIRRLSTNEGLAGMLGYFECIAGDYRYITTHSGYIDRITADDIMRTARTYFISENRTVAELIKKDIK
ncbi:MAG: pitrilysin family protein [Deltaproteobacteria bacterium]|nr:pitrilysin family protein [Deltaproteobacteria bacterium]